MDRKWRVMVYLGVAELLAMSLWFSASAVIPQLRVEWQLVGLEASMLTISVQLGFVVAALGFAFSNMADRVPAHRLFQLSAVCGALVNAAIVLRPGLSVVFLLRFLTGACLAGVYPPAMKLIVSWFHDRRGLAIGILVGATTAGSALPHLLNALPLWGGATGLPPWPAVLLGTSVAAILAAAVVAWGVRPGPHLPATAPFDFRQARRSFSDPALRRANIGYLGHMWELYAMWAWVPIFLLDSYQAAAMPEAGARLAGFGALAMGAVGCVAAGLAADRWGRTVLTSVSMIVSGTCCLIAGWLGGSPLLLTVVCLIWGAFVVADSAQFSAAISELCDPAYVGTALATQTAMGFLLTTLTIGLTPALADRFGWGIAFASLAVGPVVGTVAMLRLRAMPDARRLAGGRR